MSKKIEVSEQKIRELSQSMEVQKKFVEDTNELIRDLMVGLVNMSENLKQMQKDINLLRNADAEEEFMDLQEELQQEVPLSVPANEGQKSVLVSVPENANSKRKSVSYG